MSEKLQKVLARAGLGSRREIERWIADGRLSIDERVATLGDRVSGEERIRLDGKPLSLKITQEPPTRVIAYHKDMGTVCSHTDSEGRPTVFDDFPKLHNGRWVLVGRLDINTTGLLLATNNGELANRLMHPKYEVKREYAVRIFGQVTPQMLQTLGTGVELEDGMAHFDSIKEQGGEGRNQWFIVVLHEGRNREVRRLWESQGVQVNRLVRNSYGPIQMPRRLKRGQCEELKPAQIDQLCALVHLPSPFTKVKAKTGRAEKGTVRRAGAKKSGRKKRA